jgi:serine/threonine protein kinase
VQIQKQVAIKVLHQEMSTTPEYVARFEREAVAAARISHPNVAAATDFGRLQNGSFFLVLEYVAGTDLRTILADGPLSKERAVRIARQIASAVGAAHAVGIVHRDLKPENVMVVDAGGDPDFVKVLDFGIAKFDAFGAESSAGSSSGQPALTRIGAIFGTPDYMSPEQALGQAVDPRSDLYSIGVIFRELLSGERLFKGGAVTLMRSHVLEEAPPLPPEIARAIGPRLEGVIQRLLQKAPGARFASSAELIAALDAATAEEARGEALPRSPSYESIEDVLPKKRGGFGLALLMLVMAGGGFLYFFGIPEFVGSLSSTFLQASPTQSAAQSSGSAVAPEPSAVPAGGATTGPVIAPSDSAVATPDEPPQPPVVPPDAAPVSSADGEAAPHPSAAHVPPPKPPSPTSKPVHKQTKPSSPAKHPGQP